MIKRIRAWLLHRHKERVAVESELFKTKAIEALKLLTPSESCEAFARYCRDKATDVESIMAEIEDKKLTILYEGMRDGLDTVANNIDVCHSSFEKLDRKVGSAYDLLGMPWCDVYNFYDLQVIPFVKQLFKK